MSVKKSGQVMRHRKVLRNNMEGITKSDIRRCARRGGVKRISSDVYPEVRYILKSFLQRIVLTAVTYTEHARRKTVNVYDIIHALKWEGRPMYGFVIQPSYTKKRTSTNVRTTHPDRTHPDRTHPDSTHPDPTIPDSTIPDPTIPDSTIQDSTLQDPTLPDSTIQDHTMTLPTIPDSTIQDHTMTLPTIPDPTIPDSTIQDHTMTLPTIQDSTIQDSTIQDHTMTLPTIPDPTIQDSTIQDSTIQDHTMTPYEYKSEPKPTKRTKIVARKSIRASPVTENVANESQPKHMVRKKPTTSKSM